MNSDRLGCGSNSRRQHNDSSRGVNALYQPAHASPLPVFPVLLLLGGHIGLLDSDNLQRLPRGTRRLWVELHKNAIPNGQIAELDDIRGTQILLAGRNALERRRGRNLDLAISIPVGLHRERVAVDTRDGAHKARWSWRRGPLCIG